MAITSASTDAQVRAHFEDSYRAALGKSESAILDCLEALGYIRLRKPQGGQFAGRGFSMYEIDELEKQLRKLLDSVQSTPASLGGRNRRVKLRLDGNAGGFA